MSRAGLVSLIIFFTVCIGLTASAPLPERLSSLVKRHNDYNNDVISRSLAILFQREFEVAADAEYTKREYLSILNDREFDMEDHAYTKRDYDDVFMFNEREFDGLEHEYTKRDFSEANVLRSRSFWDKIRNGFRKAGSAIRGGFRKVNQAFKTAGSRMKSGFQKAGGAMRKGFGKVGTFFKQSGAMIGKFGLKVIAAGATVASKLVKFIPGVGSVLSTGLKGVAMGANEASNKIHAHLSGNLEKASEGMDMVMDPMAAANKLGGSAGKALGIVDSFI